MLVRLHWHWRALKPRRSLRPIVGQSQELASLLLSASPGGPPEAILCVFVISSTVNMAYPPPFWERPSLAPPDPLGARRGAQQVG